jgi:hypothetical protein
MDLAGQQASICVRTIESALVVSLMEIFGIFVDV